MRVVPNWVTFSLHHFHHRIPWKFVWEYGGGAAAAKAYPDVVVLLKAGCSYGWEHLSVRFGVAISVSKWTSGCFIQMGHAMICLAKVHVWQNKQFYFFIKTRYFCFRFWCGLEVCLENIGWF